MQRQAGVATTGMVRCKSAGRWMQGRTQGQAGVCRSAGVSTERCRHRAGGHRHRWVANVSTRIKLKRKPLTRLIVQAGRQGWPGVVGCKLAEVSTGNQVQVGGGMDRHCQAQACMGKMQTEK